MPFRIMDKRDAGKTPGLSKDIHILSEAKTGCQKLQTVPDKHVSYEVEPLVETTENDVHSIKNLLPDEDDLFSGIIDKLKSSTCLDGSEDDEDLFQSGGGMELELENGLNSRQQKVNYNNGVLNSGNNSISATISYEEQVSRTLIVRNISSSIEDSEFRPVFEVYGDIHSLYTACKHRGYIIVSYYDIRAAWSARKSLHNKLLGHMNLDIHYLVLKDDPSGKDMKVGTLLISNLDASVSNDYVRKLFGSFGEMKEMGETLQRNRYIEYYDSRAAEAAYRTLNWSNIAGKQIKLELSPNRQYLMQQMLPVLAPDELCHPGNLIDNSSLEHLGTGRPSLMTTSGVYVGSVGALHSNNEMTIGAFNGNAFSQGSFSVPGSFPVRIATGRDQFGLHEPRHVLEQENFSNSSLPNYYDCSARGISYSSFSTVADLSVDADPRILEGIHDQNKYIVDPNGQQADPHVGVFGSSWTSGCTIPEDYYLRSNSNLFQNFPSSPLGWPNSLPLSNDIHANGIPNRPELSRSSAQVLNTVSSHTGLGPDGSAPTSNLSQWSSEHAYMESTGRFGIQNKASDLAPRNYMHDGNHIGKYLNSVLSPPQNLSDFIHGVNLAASAPTSYCAPKERMRNQSNCRTEADSSHSDKMKYELDIGRVLRREEGRTTLMIKNIPNKYSAKMLLATIDEQHRGTYDFIYLPIDFKNKCNMGYAFINMIDPLHIVPFYKTFNGKKWDKFNSGKVATIAYARIQGKAALIAHFQNSSLMNEDKRCRPILFCTEGPNAGDQEPFPVGTSVRSRSSRPRNNFHEENHNQASTSNFVKGDVISGGTSSMSSSVKDSF